MPFSKIQWDLWDQRRLKGETIYHWEVIKDIVWSNQCASDFLIYMPLLFLFIKSYVLAKSFDKDVWSGCNFCYSSQISISFILMSSVALALMLMPTLLGHLLFELFLFTEWSKNPCKIFFLSLVTQKWTMNWHQFFFILTDLWSKQKPIFWPMVSYTNLNLDFCLATQFCRANVLSIDIQTMAIKTPQPQRWRLLRAEVSILFSQWLLFFISDHKNVEQCKWGRHIQLCSTFPV